MLNRVNFLKRGRFKKKRKVDDSMNRFVLVYSI